MYNINVILWNKINKLKNKMNLHKPLYVQPTLVFRKSRFVTSRNKKSREGQKGSLLL